MLLFGCVADDFTGASDAASFLEKGGLSVLLSTGVPTADFQLSEDIQCVVIALKSRTQNTADAVSDSLAAIKWLKAAGAQQFFIKYCSTFDSTPEGNIGPVADAVMQYLNVPYTILCPALPVNGRTVYHGELFVNGVPLQESPMKNHPLTPMWDSRIANLMKPQSRFSSVELYKELLKDAEKINHILSEKCSEGTPFYVIPDYEDAADGERIVEQFGSLRLLTGGSGILEPLAKKLSHEKHREHSVNTHVSGGAILLAGSCSKATLSQIAYFKAQGGLSRKIDPVQLLEGKDTEESIWRFVTEHADSPVLLYSSDTAQNVRFVQEFGKERIASMLENITASLAQRAVAGGIRRVIVAGGETSGAVTERLGFSSYRIGESVAPGVPVMEPVENPGIRLVLKSGNFGAEDFFEKALYMTGETGQSAEAAGTKNVSSDLSLQKKLSDAVWIAKSLFARNRTTGSSANMSFLHNEKIYITASGSCFGTLTPEQFSVLDLNGTHLGGPKPSKEFPLHLNVYQKKPNVQAVIHTHGEYAVLWSFVPAENETDAIPAHTPYLAMKLGTVGLVPYEKPGSKELFEAFGARVGLSDGYLLKQHGAVVPGKDLMDAFYCIEELEESAKIAWKLRIAGLR